MGHYRPGRHCTSRLGRCGVVAEHVLSIVAAARPAPSAPPAPPAPPPTLIPLKKAGRRQRRRPAPHPPHAHSSGICHPPPPAPLLRRVQRRRGRGHASACYRQNGGPRKGYYTSLGRAPVAKASGRRPRRNPRGRENVDGRGRQLRRSNGAIGKRAGAGVTIQ